MKTFMWTKLPPESSPWEYMVRGYVGKHLELETTHKLYISFIVECDAWKSRGYIEVPWNGAI